MRRYGTIRNSRCISHNPEVGGSSPPSATNKKDRKIIVFNGFVILFLLFAEYAEVGLFSYFIFASVTVQAYLQCRDSIRDDFYFILVTID